MDVKAERTNTQRIEKLKGAEKQELLHRITTIH